MQHTHPHQQLLLLLRHTYPEIPHAKKATKFVTSGHMESTQFVWIEIRIKIPGTVYSFNILILNNN